VGDSTHLDAVPTPIKGLIVESQTASEYGEFKLNLMVFGVDAPIAHNFGVGSLVVQLVSGLGEGVEFVTWRGKEVAEPQ